MFIAIFILISQPLLFLWHEVNSPLWGKSSRGGGRGGGGYVILVHTPIFPIT